MRETHFSQKFFSSSKDKRKRKKITKILKTSLKGATKNYEEFCFLNRKISKLKKCKSKKKVKKRRNTLLKYRCFTMF